MRYRLQYKEPVARPCVIGNHSMPLPSFRWKDIAGSCDVEAIVNYAKTMIHKDKYRIVDTERNDTLISLSQVKMIFTVK